MFIGEIRTEEQRVTNAFFHANENCKKCVICLGQ